MTMKKPTQILQGHRGTVHCVRWSSGGGHCVSGGADRRVVLWNPHAGRQVAVFSGHAHEVLGVAVSADSTRLATCGGDRQPFLWDVGTCRIVRKFRGGGGTSSAAVAHDAAINSVSFGGPAEGDPSSVVVTGSYDRTVGVWDCRASGGGGLVQRLTDARDSVSSVAVDPPCIVSASVDGCVRVYDVRRGLLTTDRIGPPLTSLALSHDHNCVLVSALDDCVRLIDRNNGGSGGSVTVLNEYRGHTNSRFKVESSLTHTDAHVVSGSEDDDASVVVWDLVDAKVVMRLTGGHSLVPCSVACHPTREDLLLSAGCDGNVILWSS
jgi:mitogen-activated protein kinase organizer 1